MTAPAICWSQVVDVDVVSLLNQGCSVVVQIVTGGKEALFQEASYEGNNTVRPERSTGIIHCVRIPEKRRSVEAMVDFDS